MKVDFKEVIKKNYNYDDYIFNVDPNWRILVDLYNDYDENDKTIKIPKKIHQIWLGGDLPEKYNRITQTWKDMHPDWEYKLWTDEDVESLDLINKDKFNSVKNLGMKSDLLRYEILYKFGGIYADTDFECLKSFENFLNVNIFSSVGYSTDVELLIGLIGAAPKNKILENCVFNMNFVSEDTHSDIFKSTGTFYFTRNFFRNINREKNYMVVYPQTYFYPFPNYNSISDKFNGFHSYDLKYISHFIKEESHAIHWWHTSWGKNN